MKLATTALICSVLASIATAAETKYTLNGTNTKIEWTGTKPDGMHKGGFKKLEGSVVLTEVGSPEINIVIDCTSIFSDDPKLTAHLKFPDFFP